MALSLISSSDVVTWQRYFSERQFTHDRENINAAMIASSNWNITASSSGIKLDNPACISDFLPSARSENKLKTDDELIDQGLSMGALRIDRDNDI